jgi:hypothetical protein
VNLGRNDTNESKLCVTHFDNARFRLTQYHFVTGCIDSHNDHLTQNAEISTLNCTLHQKTDYWDDQIKENEMGRDVERMG